MMIDNFDALANFLDFSKKSHFYRVMIIKRRKDNQTRADGQQFCPTSYQVVYRFFIHNKQELMNMKDTIAQRCKDNNARAYINICARDLENVAKKAQCILSEYVYATDYKAAEHVYDKAYSKAVPYTHYFLLDVDTKDNAFLSTLLAGIEYELVVPTINGHHVITKPFNRKNLSCDPTMCSVQTDSMVLLYYH